MGVCGSKRAQDNQLEDACTKIEKKFRIPDIDWDDYIAAISKYGCMGNLSRAQLGEAVDQLKIPKTELAGLVGSFFDAFRVEDGYDSAGLVYAGLFYCKGALKERTEYLRTHLVSEETGKVKKADVETIRGKFFDLFAKFVPSKALELEPDGGAKAHIQSMIHLAPEQRTEAMAAWLPLPAETEFDFRVIEEWMLAEKFSSVLARNAALKAAGIPAVSLQTTKA